MIVMFCFVCLGTFAWHGHLGARNTTVSFGWRDQDVFGRYWDWDGIGPATGNDFTKS